MQPSPWTFSLHPLDRPHDLPAAVRVRKLLKRIGRDYGLRVIWPDEQVRPSEFRSDREPDPIEFRI